MPLQIIRNDITKVTCDAIVNAANSSLLGGGGVDGAIHSAAGRELLEECKTLGGCRTGEAKITKGYNLPAKYVIHTVGPVWQGGNSGEKQLLENCYKNSLLLAKQNECETVAFPLISAGVYGYPVDQALNVAIKCISDFLMENEMLVYIVVFNKSAFESGNKLFPNIEQYIDDNYAEEHYDANRSVQFNAPMPCCNCVSEEPPAKQNKRSIFKRKQNKELLEVKPSALAPMPSSYSYKESEQVLEGIEGLMLDESFSEMLLRKIDEKGIKDSECYKKANIDRKLFSKIRTNPNYKPSKPTVLAFCIALELSLEESKEMLLKAGYALSHSYKFDVIVEYFIKNNNYNIFEINEALFYYDQNLLGS